jgi:hypothetical protein
MARVCCGLYKLTVNVLNAHSGTPAAEKNGVNPWCPHAISGLVFRVTQLISDLSLLLGRYPPHFPSNVVPTRWTQRQSYNMSDCRRGFGLYIGFITIFNTQLVTTLNCNTIAGFYTLQITTAHAKSSPACSVFTSSYLVTASNNG